MINLKETVYKSGVMPVLFAQKGCEERVISAIEKSEVPVVEILQRGDEAKEVLKNACKLKKTALVGAGTICTLEQCKEAVDLGADFIVSPGYSSEIVKWCVENDVMVIPGVSTTSEVMDASSYGLTLLKGYPFREMGGVDYFNCISGPFPGVSFVVTGFLDDRDLHLVSNPKIAGIGGVWMFQSEVDHTVISEEKIIERINKSALIGKHYRNGWGK